jgi:hypothetical protein
VQSAGGKVNLTGTGGGTLTENSGVFIDGATVQSTAGEGTVTITGTGGKGTSFNSGIRIGPTGIVKSQNGDITLTGTGKGKADHNIGIVVVGVVESTGTGNLALIGVGDNGTDSNRGIFLAGATVQATSGNVSLTGTGGGIGTSNHGIYVESLTVPGPAPAPPISPTIKTAELGKVTLTGHGHVQGRAYFRDHAQLRHGTIGEWRYCFNRYRLGTSTNNDGITSDAGGPITVQATGTGNISLTGKC